MKEDIIAKYIRLFEEYNEICDTYESCTEGCDNDIMENLWPEIEAKKEEIMKLEEDLVKKGLLTFPTGITRPLRRVK